MRNICERSSLKDFTRRRLGSTDTSLALKLHRRHSHHLQERIYMHARESHDLFKALVLVLPVDSASTDVLRSGVFHLVFANFCNVDVDAGACSKNNSDDHIVCSTAETACDQASQFLDLL